MALVRDLDRAVGNGLIKITKFASGMIKELSTNEYKLKDSDGTKTSAGIRVENTTNNRFFAFSIESENTGYFKSATTLETLGSNSTVTFVLGPGLKFEIDIDSEHKGLDVCYIESSYRTGDLMPDGTIVYADWATDWNTAHDDEVYIKFLGEVTRADLPTKDFALSAGYEGGIGDFILNEIGGRVVGYDEGRTHTTLERYNTVKIRNTHFSLHQHWSVNSFQDSQLNTDSRFLKVQSVKVKAHRYFLAIVAEKLCLFHKTYRRSCTRTLDQMVDDSQ